MPLRKHQKEFAAAIDEIINGDGTRTILCTCTPGAGKSAIPILAGKLIAAGLADAICWIVPRTSLQHQAECNFLDPFFCRTTGNRLKIRSSTNETNPCRGLNGFVTTYQAIGISDAAYQEIITKRYIVVLDEFHHVGKDSNWHQALAEIMEAAAFRVLMTGTLERGDGKPIAFLPYHRAANGGYEPDLAATAWKTIRYSRTDALMEQAIISMKFSFHDGQAEWLTAEGRHRTAKSIANVKVEDVGAALYTALKTEYAKELLAMAVDHWLKWKQQIRTSKLLVVTANIENAKQTVAFMRRLTNKPVDIATSHDSLEAQRAIKRFKSHSLDILVTIAMAYEGLDVPQVTHIACLTHIRSKPWIEQMIARAVRIDRAYPYHVQTAFVFTPDDPLMRTIVEGIEAEQIACIDHVEKKEAPEQLTLFGEEAEASGRQKIQAIGSALTGNREVTLLQGAAPGVVITPKEQEQILLRDIENHVRIFCGMNRYKPQQINAEIKSHFGKSRSEMTAPELAVVLSHVKSNFPISYQVRGRCLPVSRAVRAF